MQFLVIAAGFLGKSTGPAAIDRRLRDVISNPVFVTATPTPAPAVYYDPVLRTYYTSRPARTSNS